MIKHLVKIGAVICLLSIWAVLVSIPTISWNTEAGSKNYNSSLSVVFSSSVKIAHADIKDDDFAPENPGGKLPSFKGESGTKQIQEGIGVITDWIRNVLGAIAVLFLVYGGVMYVTAHGEGGQIDKAKATIMYAIVGLVVVVLADQIKDVFYQETPASDAGAYLTGAASKASSLVKGVIAFVEGFLATVAVAMLVYAGFTYVTAHGEQSSIDKAKRTTEYSIIGLFVVALADFMVNKVFYPEGRQLGEAQIAEGIKAIEGIINFALGFVSMIAVAFIIYGGFLYVTSGGEPDKSKKALTILKYAVTGVMLIMISYSLVGIVINGIVGG